MACSDQRVVAVVCSSTAVTTLWQRRPRQSPAGQLVARRGSADPSPLLSLRHYRQALVAARTILVYATRCWSSRNWCATGIAAAHSSSTRYCTGRHEPQPTVPVLTVRETIDRGYDEFDRRHIIAIRHARPPVSRGSTVSYGSRVVLYRVERAALEDLVQATYMTRPEQVAASNGCIPIQKGTQRR